MHQLSKRKSRKPRRGMCAFYSKINFPISVIEVGAECIVIRKMHSRDNIMLHIISHIHTPRTVLPLLSAIRLSLRYPIRIIVIASATGGIVAPP